MNENVWNFSDIREFYKEYRPSSVFGKNFKKQKILYVSREILNKEFDRLNRFLEFYNNSDSFTLDKIKYILSRFPDISDMNFTGIADISDMKRFLYNFGQLETLIDGNIKKSVKWEFYSEKLKNYLDIGGKGESFLISDEYSEDLKEIREKISDRLKVINSIKEEKFQFIKENYKLDFQKSDFYLVNKEEITIYSDKDLFYVESYDNIYYIVKPVFGNEYFSVLNEYENVVLEEENVQKEILDIILRLIKDEKINIQKYISIVQQIDIYISRADISVRFDCIRPELSTEDIFHIKNGNYIPLIKKCESLETDYQKLDVNFERRMNIIRGANMGGKSMFLRSCLFFVLLTHMGFYIPAEKAIIPFFEQFIYIGENEKKIEGLSSFGLEMYTLIESTRNLEKSTFYVIDEFARTTNSDEGTALIFGLIQKLLMYEHTFCFISTHFMLYPDSENIGFYRMQGLNYNEYLKYYNNKNDYSLRERLRLINQFMSYSLVEDSSDNKIYDAIKIANLLGVDQEIIEFSRKFLQEEV